MSFTTNAQGVPVITKDPDAILDYQVDWTDWLDTDTISSVSWPSFPSGITNFATTATTTTATIWLSGGTLNSSYDLTCRITTVGGRTEDRSFRVTCKQR
jgi:hypothetical protein